MNKWEYCLVAIWWSPTDKAYASFLAPSQIRFLDFKKDKAKGDEGNAHAALRYLAELGLDGWEVVGMTADGVRRDVLLKRPIV